MADQFPIANLNNFDALISEFANDPCRVCETLEDTCQNYDATYLICNPPPEPEEEEEEQPEEEEEQPQEEEEEPQEEEEEPVEEVTEETEETTEDTTVTPGPMIDGTTLILSTAGAYVASVGLLYIFKGSLA